METGDQESRIRSRRLGKLSKFLALLLRHQPQRFGLSLDDGGWASLPEVMEVLRGLPNFRWATRTDLMQVVEGTGDGGKRRFQVDGTRIRARYGHSLEQPIAYPPCAPPPILYHGTAAEDVPAIRRAGLQPMGRQYVHLSPDRQTALRIGQRHDLQPVILTVRAAEAYAAGVAFFQADETIYLAKHIPSLFVVVSVAAEG